MSGARSRVPTNTAAGKAVLRKFKPGEVLWTDAPSLISEKHRDTEMQVLIIELNQ